MLSEAEKIFISVIAQEDYANHPDWYRELCWNIFLEKNKDTWGKHKVKVSLIKKIYMTAFLKAQGV